MSSNQEKKVSFTGKLRAAIGIPKSPHQPPPPYTERREPSQASPSSQNSLVVPVPTVIPGSSARDSVPEPTPRSTVFPPFTDDFIVKLCNSTRFFRFSQRKLLRYNCRKFHDLSITYLIPGVLTPCHVHLGLDTTMKGYQVFLNPEAEGALTLFEGYVATGKLTPIVIHKSANVQQYELLIDMSDLFGSETLQNMAMDQVIFWYADLRRNPLMGHRSVYKLCDLATRKTRKVMQELFFSYFLGHPKQLQEALSSPQGWNCLPATWQHELVQVLMKQINGQWTRVMPSRRILCNFHVHANSPTCAGPSL
ncbi:hypothetical protein OCU04_005719 [Sclerotinia nivalis]|uniref:Uncharacterized protein n=1 Tax=Sclerotinia nivalis TaxID=352851 RepID=A0A9X0DK89_9HELO|nr:hypothetical protein OCU04_005719 [Sclerotinia nivalis]